MRLVPGYMSRIPQIYVEVATDPSDPVICSSFCGCNRQNGRYCTADRRVWRPLALPVVDPIPAHFPTPRGGVYCSISRHWTTYMRDGSVYVLDNSFGAPTRGHRTVNAFSCQDASWQELSLDGCGLLEWMHLPTASSTEFRLMEHFRSCSNFRDANMHKVCSMVRVHGEVWVQDMIAANTPLSQEEMGSTLEPNTGPIHEWVFTEAPSPWLDQVASDGFEWPISNVSSQAAQIIYAEEIV